MLESIFNIAYALVLVLFLFGLTIFVHELGHFLVARWCGLTVDAFSIGFGPAIWKRKINGVDYKIGILPFGGYVALPQMDPATGRPDSEARQRSLPAVSPGKKILVALAGVTCNMILAFVIAYIVYWGGQSYAPPEGRVIVGYVATNSPAYEAGIRIGDQIESVANKAIRTWDDFILEVGVAKENPTVRVLHRDGNQSEVVLPRIEFMGAHFIPGLTALNYCYVLGTRPGSSAEAAGLRTGDRIVELDGIELFSREHLVQLVNERAGQTIPALVERDGGRVELMVTPAYDAELKRALIGIEFVTLDVRKPVEQIKSHAMLVVRLLQKLVTPAESKGAASAVGGPVAILSMFWMYVQGSFLMALWFTCLINVNLAVLNLLPIPVLDGGHIMLSLWELITRRPASHRVVSFIWNVSAILLMSLFALLTWRDVNRFFIKRPAVEVLEQPAATNAVEAATP
ncbi:MAG TPA: RIP metalloprotease RseP [Kiritimatiellia bacterium]|nr:RIP metalloprotease RseP [Kiritimatiellia bacterium]